MRTEEFIREFRDADVCALALKMQQYPDVDAAFALQQIEGWQKARVKVPELAETDGWWWPKRLSLEQCSSEVTAKYKREVLGCTPSSLQGTPPKLRGELVDLTGGLGVDTYYLSEGAREVHYVERDEELCRLAEHNFAVAGRRVTVHCGLAEDWLNDFGVAAFAQGERVVFVDPARRDSHGGKVFRLEDCTPDVTEILPQMRAIAGRILLKLSPMLDITEAVRALGGAVEVHVVAVRNEVKEVLVLLEDGRDSMDPDICCVNLETGEEAFRFKRSQDRRVAGDNRPADKTKAEGEMILVEPNAAIVKAGAYKLFGERYGLTKLGANTHLYLKETEGLESLDRLESLDKLDRLDNLDDLENLERLPGRVFRVHEAEKEELKRLERANVVCRNYPLSAEDLRKKLRLKDGGETYVIGARVGEKPTLFVGQRQFFHTLS